MNKEQQKQWAKAQKILVSVDLVEAAKKHLKFLAAADRNRFLYGGPALRWAIYRYYAFWLPLLAMHLENPLSEEPLVVPLDCEWIWHCHRLNPVRYKLDCEKRYGRILGNHKVKSSVQSASKNMTEQIWNKLYPEEPYELDMNRSFPRDIMKGHWNEKCTSYDLVSAVKSQIAFAFQVFRPYMSDDLFLQEAVARYKGFLHLTRANRKTGIDRFCVPTYDIDLIWHTHQLYPDSYCKDLTKIVGNILEHDDTDSSRTKGYELDTGYYETTRQWEDTFGKRYWKAGTMYRGSPPTPITQIRSEFDPVSSDFNAPESFDNMLQFSAGRVVEAVLEFVEIKNLPVALQDNLSVSFSKKQSDRIFNTKKSLSIFSESGDKQVANFLCEPTGEFLFELQCRSPSNKLLSKTSQVFGYCCLSLQELVASRSQLSVDKWITVHLVSGVTSLRPILLRVSFSFTPPSPAPQVFHLEQPRSFLKKYCSCRKYCIPPFLQRRKVKHSEAQSRVTYNDGMHAFSLQMRNIAKNGKKCASESLKEVMYIRKSGEKRKVAAFDGNHWFIDGVHGSSKLINNYGHGNHHFELFGSKKVKLFSGRKLEFEPRYSGTRRCEQDFLTVVEFSADDPYGIAIALLDLKLGTIKVLDEWIVLPAIVITFILFDVLKREGFTGLTQIGSKVITSTKNRNGRMEAEVALDEAEGDKEKGKLEIKSFGIKSDCASIHPMNSGEYDAAKCGGEC